MRNKGRRLIVNVESRGSYNTKPPHSQVANAQVQGFAVLFYRYLSITLTFSIRLPNPSCFPASLSSSQPASAAQFPTPPSPCPSEPRAPSPPRLLRSLRHRSSRIRSRLRASYTFPLSPLHQHLRAGDVYDTTQTLTCDPSTDQSLYSHVAGCATELGGALYPTTSDSRSRTAHASKRQLRIHYQLPLRLGPAIKPLLLRLHHLQGREQTVEI